MTRYLIARTAYSEEEIAYLIDEMPDPNHELTPERVIESSEWGLAPDSPAELVVEAFHKRLNYLLYKNKNDFVAPKYEYHSVEPTSPDADWLVYRKTDTGDILCISGVCAECVRPEMEICSVCGAQNPEPWHGCRFDNS